MTQIENRNWQQNDFPVRKNEYLNVISGQRHKNSTNNKEHVLWNGIVIAYCEQRAEGAHKASNQIEYNIMIKDKKNVQQLKCSFEQRMH